MIAVVCHDAGGAEVVSSYIVRSGLKCVCVLDGPAVAIFERKLAHPRVATMVEAVRAAEWVLTGSSWESDLELGALRLARSAHKHSVTFLDHWVNFRERFVRSGVATLPDEIWVGDPDALEIARVALPGMPVCVVENPYLLDLVHELEQETPARRLNVEDGVTILFLSEPVRQHALRQHGDERFWGYVEEDALRNFLDHAVRLARHERIARIVIRPHPSERPGKYDHIAGDYDLPIVIGGGTTLAADIAASDVVVGCNSMAMVVALAAGKRVVCCIPPDGRPCVLPHVGIEPLASLVSHARNQ
jgi:hypothetical protein